MVVLLRIGFSLWRFRRWRYERLFVDDGVIGGEGRGQRLDGQVVDCAGVTA
ncbi:hypothetical protein I546_2246 [Mycobacterium kansasii 732]|nr:hypothetical protein I546_2246 [Mycobacterium kansasii 732]